MRSAKDYLSEANEIVEKIDSTTGIELHSDGAATFIDVRDSAAICFSSFPRLRNVTIFNILYI